MFVLPARPVVITGMHRSGTSTAASFMVELGIHLGNRFLSSDPGNPRGSFEDIDFVELHRRILEAATPERDGGHRDWGWTESEFLDRSHFHTYGQAAQDLVATRATGPGLWGWKDPRTSLLLDFWDEIFAGQALYVFLYRFPWEVADSIQRVDAGPFLNNPEYAWRIWSFYNRQLLDFFHRHSERAILISSNAFLRDPGFFVGLLRNKLRLPVEGTGSENVWQHELLAAFDPDDPLIRLTLATSPECGHLLEELDAHADLPSTGLWRKKPLLAKQPPPSDPIDLSVVIPCYNHGQFLVDAIASVERTAPERYELIVVNDGSNQPRTLEVLEILREAGYRIIDQPNLGLAAARNNGIRAARGRYVLPLDADNLLVPGFIASAVQVLNTQPEVGIVYGHRLDFGARSGLVHVPNFDLNLLLRSNFIDACAVSRREVWENCGGYDAQAHIYEDWEFMIAAAKRGWRFHRLPKVTFEYRVRPNSMLATAPPDRAKSSHEYILCKHHTLYRQVIRMDKLSPEEVSQISLQVDRVPGEVRTSAMFRLEALVTNATNKILYPVVPCPVRLAYHWIERTSRQIVVFEGYRSGLFPALAPNAREYYPMTIIAPHEPGEYTLQTTLVQEGVCWFEDIRPGIMQEFALSVTP